MMLIHDWDAPTFQLGPGTEVVRLAGPDIGSTETNVWRVNRPEGPVAPFPHQHNREEILIVTRGSLIIVVADEEVKVEAGDTLIVPPMTQHNILESGVGGVEYLAIFPVGNRWYHLDCSETPPMAPA